MLVNAFDKEVCNKGLLPEHAHHNPHSCLIVEGGMVDRLWPGRTAPALPGEILVHPGGANHVIEAGDDGLVCVVIEWSKPLRHQSFQSMMMERPLQSVVRLTDDLSTANPAREAIVRHEIMAEVSRTIACRRYVDPPNWLIEARAVIRLTATGTSISKLARWAGVHRATLTQRFRDAYGMPPEHYKMLVKLEYAVQLMASGQRLTEVAFDSGFSDQAHLCRAWRRYLGGTPKHWLANQATIVQDFPSRSVSN